jgi:hypothetical protein
MNIQSIFLVMIGPPQVILLLLSVPFFIAIVDLIRFNYTGNNRLVWSLIVLFIPFIGAIIYLFSGRKQRIIARN